jgi:hypothetical protein
VGDPWLSITLTLCHILHSVSHWPVLVYFINMAQQQTYSVCGLAGAMKLAVMDGPLYVHSNGLVFVSRPTKVHVLLLDQVRPILSDVRPVC